MKVGYTFNWLYTDDRDIAYINTGANPIRPKAVNGLLPIRHSAKTEWKGFDAATNLATYQPMHQRPQSLNQPYLVSWNNKQARHCCGGSEYTAVWRSTLITFNVPSMWFSLTVPVRVYGTKSRLPWTAKPLPLRVPVARMLPRPWSCTSKLLPLCLITR